MIDFRVSGMAYSYTNPSLFNALELNQGFMRCRSAVQMQEDRDER